MTSPTTLAEPPTVDTAIPESGCPRCGTPREPGRRFCERCGFQLVATTRADPPAAAAAAPAPWWRRWFSPKGSAERSARRAWRRSLPMSFRIRRWVAGVVAVALVGGGLSLIGRNPVGWIVDRYHDLRGTVEVVADVNAATQPASAEIPSGPAAAAVDSDPLTAWLTYPHPVPAGVTCLPPESIDQGSDGSLLINLGGVRRVETVVLYAGLPTGDPNRLTQPRPKTLQVGYAGGCRILAVADDGGEQRLAAEFTAESVWITVTDVWPAASGDATQPVSLSEVTFLARP